MSFDYDLFVIGAGSAGVRASRMSAGFGAKVAICEDTHLGGTCVNLGCVPKKLYVYGSSFRDDWELAASYGWDLEEHPAFNWSRMVANKDQEIARLNHIYEHILENAGVDLVRGRGRIVDPHCVEVNGERYRAEKILVATGGKPWVPNIPGAEHGWTSDDMFRLSDLPRRVLVVGGGYIGVEFAGILRGFGTQVTLVDRGSCFLRGFDDDIREHLATEMRKRGVDVRFNTTVDLIEKAEQELVCTLHDGEKVGVDGVLFATGRRPRVGGLGLESAGVETDELGAVIVDPDFQTTVPSIYAMGDVTNRHNLTPVALAEGMAFARTQYGGTPERPDYNNIATAVFSQPNLATVGLTEGQARLAGHDVQTFKSSFRPMKVTMAKGTDLTLMKLIVDKTTDRVLGCHMVGPDAGEIIQGLAVAMTCGATKTQFDRTIGIHPTAAEEFVTMRTPST